MPTGFVHSAGYTSLKRGCLRGGLASLMLLLAAPAVQDATADGQTRTLSFHHTHSRESLTVTYKRNGRYDEAALKQLNHFLRDWRSQEQITMDRKLFDVLWEVYRDVDAKQPINIISSYRSPSTNSMLRRRSANSGVARSSQHTQGRAIDFFIPGVALEKIRFAGLRMQRGGVGFYPTSGSPFVHLDTGGIRHWPRMTPAQLARVFPDGRTVHVPTDGKPLAGYQLAMADIQRRGDGDSQPATAAPSRFLASLFNRNKPAETPVPAPQSRPAPSDAEPAQPVGLIASVDTRTTAAVPMPRAKPAAAAQVQLASAEISPLPPTRAVAAPSRTAPAAQQQTTTLRTPADIINSRGFWDDMPSRPQQATPEQIAVLNARRLMGAVEPRQPDDHQQGQALAYAPTHSPLSNHQITAASAPLPRSVRPASSARAQEPMGKGTTIISKGARGQSGRVMTSARIVSAQIRNGDVWMRAMILAPSMSGTMRITTFGDQDMTTLAPHFAKPSVTINASFSNDPANGLNHSRFTGPAVVALPTQAFARTAALR